MHIKISLYILKQMDLQKFSTLTQQTDKYIWYKNLLEQKELKYVINNNNLLFRQPQIKFLFLTIKEIIQLEYFQIQVTLRLLSQQNILFHFKSNVKIIQSLLSLLT
ncbi:hypothetical protein TTHERM_000414170 (macronuclear) [Tetrahymena thermophila SB210]|uniref:Uncharacterized protein n=1 Tax=Tetrahymena thermophila (strain SB210) TaxID=312017 RepID=W7XLN6_TETTS|nr:hypothetical protein TTHERM_000414170 [Tetrahymena thermophila SB210]EWS76604.1 hypothetical protein TTHERM_000414170 [Tetrahymena thermophila SB210]|eukprot:XP_012650890.1 hypothetical protein TTHERM_000414170 [Tetrahymena thermophila SB210]